MSRLARGKEKGNLTESLSKWEGKRKHEELESLAERTEPSSYRRMKMGRQTGQKKQSKASLQKSKGDDPLISFLN